MSNRITIRFYTVEKFNPETGFSLHEAIEAACALGPPAEREKQLAEGYVLRLERYEEGANEFSGEFTRVRSTGFPYDVRADGVAPLNNENRPIGDGIAFRFRRADHTLAIQYDPRTASPGRIIDYLLQCDPRGAFVIKPKVDPENWRKFRESPLRKLRVGIASPQHLGEIEDENAAVFQSFRDLGEAYGAPVITLELSMGHSRGSLLDTAKTLATQIFGMSNHGDADLRSLKGTVKTEEGEEAEEINLLDEVLSDKDELDLPGNEPDRSYEIRRNFLEQKLLAHGVAARV